MPNMTSPHVSMDYYIVMHMYIGFESISHDELTCSLTPDACICGVHAGWLRARTIKEGGLISDAHQSSQKDWAIASTERASSNSSSICEEKKTAQLKTAPLVST